MPRLPIGSTDQEFTVARRYEALETFTVIAPTPEEAIKRLEDEGPETDHVSERQSDSYEDFLGHAVYDADDTLVLDKRHDTTTALTPSEITIGFTIQRRGDDLYFRATHKAASDWHGPYAADTDEMGIVIAYAIDEQLAETLLHTPSDAPGR